MSLRYQIKRYRGIYGDGMNSFQNESHSGIMNSPLGIFTIRCSRSVTANKCTKKRDARAELFFLFNLLLF